MSTVYLSRQPRSEILKLAIWDQTSLVCFPLFWNWLRLKQHLTMKLSCSLWDKYNTKVCSDNASMFLIICRVGHTSALILSLFTQPPNTLLNIEKYCLSRLFDWFWLILADWFKTSFVPTPVPSLGQCSCLLLKEDHYILQLVPMSCLMLLSVLTSGISSKLCSERYLKAYLEFWKRPKIILQEK